MDPALILPTIAAALSGFGLIALGIEHRRYVRLRRMYYQDQCKQARQRWERDAAFRG